jgi:tetratricopeptide (TPR) repeat protein
MEMEARAVALRDEAKPWYRAAAESSQRFISEHEKYAARFADGKEEMPLHEKIIFEQEAKNKFAGFLLLMQVEFGAENWDSVLSWAERLTEDSVPESMRGAVLPVSNLMHFLAIIKKLDIEKDPVETLAVQLDKAQKVRSLIGKYADAEDPTALQAIMVQGDHWLKLAGRAKGDEAKAKVYRLNAGEAFVEAIEVVDKNVNFAIVMGPIFTEQGMYDKAEEIYDRAIEKWDTEEKRPPMPSKKEVAFAATSINAKYLGQGGQMKDLHTDLRDLLFPKTRGVQPDDLAAIAKINQIVAEGKKMNVPGVEELPTKDLMARLKTAVRFRNTMLRVKSGLILAKADSEKWDEAMALADDVLKISKGDKRIQLLKATVHIRRADKAGSLAKAKEDLTVGSNLIATLTFHKKKKLPKFSASWWEAMALFYEANKIKYLYEPKGKTAKAKVPAEMRMIKMWQRGRNKPTELFIDRTNALYGAYIEINLLVKKTPKEAKQYMLRRKVEAPTEYEKYWELYPKKMETWGLPKPPPEKEDAPAEGKAKAPVEKAGK